MQYYPLKHIGISWEEARGSRKMITEYLASGGREMNVAKFKLIKDMREFFCSKVGEERTSSLM